MYIYKNPFFPSSSSLLINRIKRRKGRAAAQAKGRCCCCCFREKSSALMRGCCPSPTHNNNKKMYCGGEKKNVVPANAPLPIKGDQVCLLVANESGSSDILLVDQNQVVYDILWWMDGWCLSLASEHFHANLVSSSTAPIQRHRRSNYPRYSVACVMFWVVFLSPCARHYTESRESVRGSEEEDVFDS